MSARTALIERRLEQEDLHIAVEEEGNSLVLSGLVGTSGEKDMAVEIVASLAPGCAIEDNIDVTGAVPHELAGFRLDESNSAMMPGATPELTDEESLEPGDFTDQEIIRYAAEARGPGTSLEDDVVSEGSEVYIPPMDPVSNREGEVLGGLSQSSMDDVSVARSALDNRYGDEALRDAILRELAEDSATTGLDVDVEVFQRVAVLRGRVPYLFDAENAEEVAARVPGLSEVREELEVENL